MHKLFVRQLEKATGADGAVDIAQLSELVSSAYDDHDRDRRRTERSMGLMIDEINKTNARLAEAFEAVPEGLVLLDAQNRYVRWNSRYAEIYSRSAEHLVVGGSFEASLRANAVLNVDAAGREDGWVADRMALLAQSSNSHEQRLLDDRWIRVEERRTADGGSIGIRIDITELKRREASIRLLFENNPIPMWVIDRASLAFLDVNAAAISHYGYSREQFLAMTALDIRPKEDWDELQTAIRADGARAVGRMRRHILADGTQIEVAIYSQSLKFAGYDAFLVVAIDLTERRLAEAELRRTKVFLDTVIDNVPAMIMVREARDDNRFVLVNRAFEEFFSRRREDVIGKTIGQVLPPNLIERIIDEDQRLLVQGKQFSEEYAIPTPTHGVRNTTLNRILVKGDDNKPRYIVSVMDDISDRRQAENRQLESNKTLQAVIDASPVAIISIDRSAVVLTWNQAAESIFGYSAEEAVGASLENLIVPPDERETFRSHFQTTLASHQPLRGLVRQRIRKDGSPVSVKVTTALVFAADGSALTMVGAFEDMTKRDLLEEQLRQSQKMEAIGQLTGGLAHDFNNLLAIVIGNLDLLRGNLEGDADGTEILDEALQASLQGAELNQRLLAFARRQPLQPKNVALESLVTGLVKLLSRTLGGQFSIDVSMQPGLWRMSIDPVQLESALTNLAVNARDAMPDGGRLTFSGRNLSVDAEMAEAAGNTPAGDYVVIEVTDTGGGMPPEVVARVFEPFFTTKGKERGTGLGLSMVFGFIKQSGGYVEIYSEVGVGTTLRLYLPRAMDAATETSETTTAAAAPGGNEHVLAVEDNGRLRHLLVRQLKDLGYRVSEAEDARTALETLGRESDVDLLLTDIIMPGGKNGRELAIEAQMMRPGLKVLFTSGFPEGAFGGSGALALGGVLLSKPYRRDELARRVRESLAENAGP